MRIFTSSFVAGLCLAAVQLIQAQDLTILLTDDPPTAAYVGVNSETANNTSACFAAGNPSYCNQALPNLLTSSANQAAGAETITADAFPEHVSTISVKRLMYSGWNGQLICEYQPWFSNSGGTSHINVGYDEHDPATLARQDSKMISRGCNVNLVSFYGRTDPSPDLTFDRITTDKVYGDLALRGPNYKLKFAVLEIAGAFFAQCTNKSETLTISCIETALEADMTYVHDTYTQFNPGLYWTDQGTNVIGYFGACGDFSALSCGNHPNDWDTIWSAVQTFVNSPPHNYNFKFIFEFGNFNNPTISAGEYAWPQPYTNPTCLGQKNCFTSNPPSQYYWCDPIGVICNGHSSGYLDNFYAQGALNYPSKLTIGLLYSGFDDSNAVWGVDRVVAQRCGHVLLDTANQVVAGGFWGKSPSKTQIPYMMLATWNDYEEGTAVESGVDNCYTSVNTTLSGSTMNWTLTNSDLYDYADTRTIHHYALWTAPVNGTNLTLRKQVGPTETSFDLSALTLPSGTYDVYLEMIGQPSMQNEMSNKITYTRN